MVGKLLDGTECQIHLGTGAKQIIHGQVTLSKM